MESQKSGMTVDSFYDYITQHISPEVALKRMLSSSFIAYENLKFDEKGKEVHPLLIITMAAMDLGWQMEIERDQPEVRGIAVGSEEYMNARRGKNENGNQNLSQQGSQC